MDPRKETKVILIICAIVLVANIAVLKFITNSIPEETRKVALEFK